MLPFNSWGDPYADDNSWRTLKIGDKVRVKTSVAFTGSNQGVLEEITDEGTYMVRLSNDLVMGYDADMLVKI